MGRLFALPHSMVYSSNRLLPTHLTRVNWFGEQPTAVDRLLAQVAALSCRD